MSSQLEITPYRLPKIVFDLEYVTFDNRGMVVNQPLSYEHWEKIGRVLGTLDAQTQLFFMWAWGDWLTYGEFQHGEMYSQAISVTGKAPQTLANYKWIASHIPRHLRGLPGLCQSHYTKVASIKDVHKKEKILRDASENGLTSSGEIFVKSIQSAKGDTPKTTPPPPATPQDTINLLQQQHYTLEQRYQESVVRQKVLEQQIAKAANTLKPVPDQVSPQTKLVVTQALTHLVDTSPNDDFIQTVQKVVNAHREKNTMELITYLDRLSQIMEDHKS